MYSEYLLHLSLSRCAYDDVVLWSDLLCIDRVVFTHTNTLFWSQRSPFPTPERCIENPNGSVDLLHVQALNIILQKEKETILAHFKGWKEIFYTHTQVHSAEGEYPIKS